MALAINFIDRRGSSNEMHCQLQPKKTMYYYIIIIYYIVQTLHGVLTVYIAAKDILPALQDEAFQF